MGLFDAMEISGTALSAERLRMDVTAENLANAQTTRTATGGPYRRKDVVLAQAGEAGNDFGSMLESAQAGGAGATRGVQVVAIAQDNAPPRMVYDPGHPDANAQGYVAMPNVNTVTEMVDLIGASRAYEASVTALQSEKSMFGRTLDILK